MNRSGNMRASPLISIAVIAALRATPGTMPMPTVSRCVVAREAATAVRPPAQKQSSTIHSSSSPNASISRAQGTRSSGGRSRRNIAPRRTDGCSRVMPGSPDRGDAARAGRSSSCAPRRGRRRSAAHAAQLHMRASGKSSLMPPAPCTWMARSMIFNAVFGPATLIALISTAAALLAHGVHQPRRLERQQAHHLELDARLCDPVP